MTDYSTRAKELFLQGYNCSQSVVGAFAEELGMDFATAMRLSSSFGGGMGRLREVCGAVTGMFIVAGLTYGYSDPAADQGKKEHYQLIQSLAMQFKKENESIICRELLGLPAGADEPEPEKRTPQYYQARPCEQLVEYGAGLIGEYIKTKQMEEKKMEKKMRIAVASEGSNVTEHFGHCENFNLFDVENNQIVNRTSIPNPGHKPGFLPNYLNDIGVNVIISGGMGGGAVEIFNEKNIEVITGAQGNAEELAKKYLNGELESTGSICHEHQHHDECGESK